MNPMLWDLWYQLSSRTACFPHASPAWPNREVIGIVTKIHNPQANVKLATSWLQLAGCKKIFYVDSKQQEGIPEILEYLREEGDVMPWEEAPGKPKADLDEPEDTSEEPSGKSTEESKENKP